VTDLLIGLGIPLLQVLAQYVVSGHRYNIYEDFGCTFAMVNMPPTYILFFAWPIAIGCVSLVYCVRTIFKFKQILSFNRGLNRGRYLRLMALSSIEILGTIPLGIYFLISNARSGVIPWKSWADTHSNYSRVIQVPAFIWKNNHDSAVGLEVFRWLLIFCAFVFFAFFGFAVEARHHYRLVYTSLASRIGLLTSSGNLHGSSHATSSFPHMKSKSGINVSVVTASGDKRNSTVSFTDQLSLPSISLASDLKPDFKIEEYSPSDSVESDSIDSFESESQRRSPQPDAMTPTVGSGSDLLHPPYETQSITYPNDATDTV